MLLQQGILTSQFHEDGDFGTQYLGYHGLSEVVHRANIVTAKDMLFTSAEGGNEDDGRGTRALTLPDQRCGFEAIHYRHHDVQQEDRKSTRLNSSHLVISYAVFCLKKKKKKT